MNDIPYPELESLRAEFPILQSRVYLNSCSLGALSRRSMGYLGEYQALWNTMGASAWYELWLGRVEELRGRLARLWEGGEEEVGFSPSVSAALASLASAVDYRQRPRVVVAELDFPTLPYQWMVRPDVEVVRVRSDDGVGIAPERWAEQIDARTAIVATSHVFYSTGHVQDLRPIAELARQAGALFVVDGYQAMGQLAVNPRELGADAYVAGPLKWMLGGPGLAYLWVRRERIEQLRPTMTSWFAAANQFGFGGDEFHFREDAGRFALGTPAMPTVYTALGGAEIVEEAGIERIQRRIAALTADLVERLQADGVELRIAPAGRHRSGIVMARMADAAGAVEGLARRGIIVDRRGDHVRISPHFYNTREENERVVAALAEVRKG